MVVGIAIALHERTNMKKRGGRGFDDYPVRVRGQCVCFARAFCRYSEVSGMKPYQPVKQKEVDDAYHGDQGPAGGW